MVQWKSQHVGLSATSTMHLFQTLALFAEGEHEHIRFLNTLL